MSENRVPGLTGDFDRGLEPKGTIGIVDWSSRAEKLVAIDSLSTKAPQPDVEKCLTNRL